MDDALEQDAECESPEAELPPQPGGPMSLLHELDARQNALLDELDLLNSRIEKVIAEWGSWRGDSTEKPALPVAA